ncbi:MAG: beta-galactosidase [Bacteroidota bacterium]|nr:beta-galactosidase [Bacteroidota bacterium]
MKNKILTVTIALICFLAAKANVAFSQSNDHIFPAATVAKSTVDFDSRGFIINGKRTFLVSAGLEYARIPHQLWYDRLLRLKRAGFNCIEIYLFWNFHEPKEGVFDFSGDHDLDAFLKLVKKLDMYAIARVGPYYCAEWDFGGYPIWLRFKDNLVARNPNAAFEKYTDRFFDKLIPIVANNQINHGGSVVLVQLENEHPLGWGTAMPNEYFKHLQSKALSLGLQVPYFFSGLHHGSDPAGNKLSLDDPNRPNPWFSTEFWSVWYNYYGSSQEDANTYGRRTWKIIAHGGDGYNYYMAHGGTNFGYTNNNEDAASYDYGAAVGQTGDLRPIYYQFKKNAFFARSFQQILENSQDAGAVYDSVIADSALRVNGRHSNNGDIVFVDNPGKNNVSDQLKIEENLKQIIELAPGEIFHLVHNYNIATGVKLDWSVVRILGTSKQGNTTTLVVYGEPKSAGYLKFSTAAPVNILEGKNAFTTKGSNTALSIIFDENAPVTYTFKSKTQTIRVLAVSSKLADRTWFADVKGKNYVITGPEYLAQASFVNKQIQLQTEHFWEQKDQYQSMVFGEGLGRTILKSAYTKIKHEESVLFSAQWQVKNASAAAGLNFNDQLWLKSKNALQMGADNDLTADAWYRTSFTVGDPGLYVLKVKKGGDRATVFVDGEQVASGYIHNNDLKFNLKGGQHRLAVFTAHDGRDKLFNYLGSLQDVGAKGLMDEVYLQKSKDGDYITDWKMLTIKGMTKMPGRIKIPEDLTGATTYKIGDDAFDKHSGFAWFQAKIPYDADHVPSALDFGGIDDNAIIFVNGKRVLRQNGYDISFSLALDGLLKKDSVNLVTLLIENTDGEGGISKPVEIVYNDKSRITLTNWSMKGGPGDYTTSQGWRTLTAADKFDRPQFFKSTFILANVNTNSKSMYRVTFEGLGHGSVWINGYNIGRYPEKIPVKSMYMPESWLKKGLNSIVVYDEDGKTPEKIKIEAEIKASRDIITEKF